MKNISLLFFILCVFIGFAQDHEMENAHENPNSYSPFSLKEIREYEVMYKKKVVRMMDLREQHNKPLFTEGHEITKLLFEAIHQGVVTPYTTDSLWRGGHLSVDQFMEKLLIPDVDMEYESLMEQEEDQWAEDNTDEEEENDEFADEWNDDFNDDDFNDDNTQEDDPYADPFAGEDFTTEISFSSSGEHFVPTDLYLIEFTENVLFSRHSMEAEYDILSITLFIPADHPDNIMGIDIPVATFSYKELVENVFRDNPNATWMNPYNDSEHRNLEKAFEMRLFSSYIIKVSNLNDDFLVDIYDGDPEEGIAATQWKNFELLEYEQCLWEY